MDIFDSLKILHIFYKKRHSKNAEIIAHISLDKKRLPDLGRMARDVWCLVVDA